MLPFSDNPNSEETINKIAEGILALPPHNSNNEHIWEEFFQTMERLYGLDAVEEAKKKHGEIPLVEEVIINNKPTEESLDEPQVIIDEPALVVERHFSEVEQRELEPDGNGGWRIRGV